MEKRKDIFKMDYYVLLDKILEAIGNLHKDKSKQETERTYLNISQLADKLNISTSELISLHEKLVNEGYAVTDDNTNLKLTATGVLFLKSGGFTKLKAELQYSETKERVLHIGSILAGIWASMEILKMLYQFFLWFCQC